MTAPADDTPVLLDVARRYYWNDESKVSIAEQLGVSRFQVARMLQEARRTGLVRIDIGSPGHVDEGLSAQVADRLGITRAIVVAADRTSSQATFDLVGIALAGELERVAPENGTVGLAWSRAAPAMVRALSRLPHCAVVQLSGAIYPPSGLPGSVEVTRDVAAAAGGPAHILYAPLIVPDAETAAGLRRQPEIAATLSMADALDIAVLSVGAWRRGASAVYEQLTTRERADLADLQIVGEVSGRLFDQDGQPVRSPLDDRVIGARIDQLRNADLMISTGCGAHRREATIAVSRAGLINTLIIDDELAMALLS